MFYQNYPLYIRCVPTQNELKFHYTVHTSLDVVEEKISAVGKSLGDQRELYLGLLYPTEDYKVYPWFGPASSTSRVYGESTECHRNCKNSIGYIILLCHTFDLGSDQH